MLTARRSPSPRAVAAARRPVVVGVEQTPPISCLWAGSDRCQAQPCPSRGSCHRGRARSAHRPRRSATALGRGRSPPSGCVRPSSPVRRRAFARSTDRRGAESRCADSDLHRLACHRCRRCRRHLGYRRNYHCYRRSDCHCSFRCYHRSGCRYQKNFYLCSYTPPCPGIKSCCPQPLACACYDVPLSVTAGTRKHRRDLRKRRPLASSPCERSR
jgi:hypothetical protein